MVSWLIASRPERARHPATCSGLHLTAEQLLDGGEVFRREAPVAARTGAAAVGALLRGEGAIAAVRPGAVAADFAADRAAVSAERAGDFGLVEPLPSEGGEHIPLLGGELAVRHGEYPLRGG